MISPSNLPHIDSLVQIAVYFGHQVSFPSVKALQPAGDHGVNDGGQGLGRDRQGLRRDGQRGHGGRHLDHLGGQLDKIVGGGHQGLLGVDCGVLLVGGLGVVGYIVVPGAHVPSIHCRVAHQVVQGLVGQCICDVQLGRHR